jgi:hypothetical protein
MALAGLTKTTVGITYAGTEYFLGEAKTFSGGNAATGSNKSRRGAGQPQRARNGQETVSNVVVSFEDDGSVDFKFFASVRKHSRMWVKRTPADDDGNARDSDSWTYTGVPNEFRPGNSDVEDESGIDMLEIEMVCDSVIS